MASYEPEVDVSRPQWNSFRRADFLGVQRRRHGRPRGRADGLYSRKTLVPILMNIVAGAFLPTGEHRPFWGRYWDAWLQAAGPEADVWRRRFEAKAVELGERGLVVLTPEADLPVDAVRRITSWTKALETAAGDFRDANDEPRLSPELLAHQLAHLMNNRLGVLPLEEAYYSSLIHHALGREVSA